LINYIENYNLNNYILIFIVYIIIIKNIKKFKFKSEPIIIIKLYTKNLKKSKSYKKIINLNYKNYWFKSEIKELNILNNNNIYELIPKPKKIKVLNNR
jgi:hypothetical protein